MSDEPTERSDGRIDRRRVLRTAGAALAAGTVVAGVETASASSHCHYEYQCLEVICPYESDDGGLLEMRRECCEGSDGTVECSDWQSNGCCSYAD